MFKSEEELRAEARRFEEESKAKSLLSIKNKLMGVKEEPKIERISYEEAMAQGDVKTMLAYKLGTFREQDRQQEQAELFKGDISEITKEYRGIEAKINAQKSIVEKSIELAKQELKSEVEQKLKDFRGMRGGMAEELIRVDYYKALEGIEDTEQIKSLKKELLRLTDRRVLLQNAVNRYVEENKDIIAEEQRKKKVLEINRAGILDLMD